MAAGRNSAFGMPMQQFGSQSNASYAPPPMSGGMQQMGTPRATMNDSFNRQGPMAPNPNAGEVYGSDFTAQFAPMPRPQGPQVGTPLQGYSTLSGAPQMGGMPSWRQAFGGMNPFGMLFGAFNPASMPGMQQQQQQPAAPQAPQPAAPTAPVVPQQTYGFEPSQVAALPEDQRRFYSFDPETYTYYKSG